MSCPRTQHLLKEYFSDELSKQAKEKIETHVAACEYCYAELSDVLEARETLEGWRQQKAPHWDRGSEVFRRAHGKSDRLITFWDKMLWQLIPTSASLFMLLPPIGLFAAIKFYKEGYVDIFAALYMGLIFTIFASISSGITININRDTLRKGFGIFTMISGLYIFLNKEE